MKNTMAARRAERPGKQHRPDPPLDWGALREIQNARLSMPDDSAEDELARLVALARATMPTRFGLPGAPPPSASAFWRAVGNAISADGPEQDALASALGAGSMLRAHDTPAEEWIARTIPAGSEGAEIGVWRGKFSQLLVDVSSPKRLHLVDPWVYQPSFPMRVFGGKKGLQQDGMDAIYESVRRMFAGSPEVLLHRKMSSDALDGVKDDSLDWVYVDGNHHYEWVLADLRGWWKKVKPGGLLTGDDFMWGEMYGRPVRRAVLEFVSQGTVDFISAERKYFVLRKRTQTGGT